MMSYFNAYDHYIEQYSDDPDDGDDPVIRQLQLNALFEEDADGWIIVLPKPKPTLKPQNYPHLELLDSSDDVSAKVQVPMEQHNRIVESMTVMALKMAGRTKEIAEPREQPLNELEWSARLDEKNKRVNLVEEFRNIDPEGTIIDYEWIFRKYKPDID